MKVLQLKTSILGQYSVSNQLSNEFLDSYLTRHQSATSEVLDFAATAIPHIDGQLLGALSTEQANRDDSQSQLVNFADGLIAQFQSSDIIVLGLPMYNFNVPSMLSAYFDHLARAGVTFQYTDQGAVGLLENKKVYVLATRGGIHQGLASDTQTAYVKQFFAFLGLSDVEFIYAEGLNMGDEAKESALTKARSQMAELVKQS